MGVAVFDEPAQDKWPDDYDLHVEIQRCIEKLRLLHPHDGIRCEEAGCIPKANPEVNAQIDERRRHFQMHYRSSRTFKTDYKVIDAFFKRGREIGSLDMDMSQRELCRLATVSGRDTVARSIGRLVLAGYLKRRNLRGGKPLRIGKAPIPARAYRYRLMLPDDKVGPHTHRDFGVVVCGPTMSMLDANHDQWWYSGGLSATRRTYELLLMGTNQPSEIAESQGLCTRQIRRHLEKLDGVGLAEKKVDGTWVAFERPPNDVAEEIGTLGKGKEKAALHAQETETYREYLRLRKNEEDRCFQELEDRGHVWIDSVLVPPEAAKRELARRARSVRSQSDE